jgi:hypothetical protein
MASDQDGDLAQIGEATVACRPAAASAARTVVSQWLDASGRAEFRDDARLLVSELVSNSVRHARQQPGAPCASEPSPRTASSGWKSKTAVGARSAGVQPIPGQVASG